MTVHQIYIQGLVDRALIGARADDPVLPEPRRRRRLRRRPQASQSAPRSACAPVLTPRGTS
jgi:hypothetical protein